MAKSNIFSYLLNTESDSYTMTSDGRLIHSHQYHTQKWPLKASWTNMKNNTIAKQSMEAESDEGMATWLFHIIQKFQQN